MKIIIEMFSELYEQNILKDFGMWSKDTNRPIVLFYKNIIFFINWTDHSIFRSFWNWFLLAQKLKIVLVGPASAVEPSFINLAGNWSTPVAFLGFTFFIDLGRTWFRNFRVHGVRQNSLLKQAKLDTLEYSGVNQAITAWIVKNNTIRLPRKRKKCQNTCAFNPFYLWPYIFDMNNYQNLSGKTEQISQYSVGSALPSCFGTGHMTVLSTPPRKMEYFGVCQHTFSSALDFCSACLE